MVAAENAVARAVGPEELRERIVSEEEIALLDVREEGLFARGHVLLARSLPLSRLELGIRDLVPRRATPIVLCDDDDGLAARAAERLKSFGYDDLGILSGGLQAWGDAGFATFDGVSVPSKAFGEFIETAYETPSITAEELKGLVDSGSKLLVLDSRPFEEYHRMNIPTGIDAPGAELVYRVHDLVDDAETLVVVNCAGRTRSIIGCQSLINAGIGNRVVALENGTMGWRLAGYELEHGQDRRASAPTANGLAKALDCAERVAKRFGVRPIDLATFAAWQAERDQRALYVFDVRSPEEYAAGHLPGSISAPGGQLVQGIDRYVGTLRARIVLVDGDGVRANMTASWLRQMGWSDAVVLAGAFDGAEMETGPHETEIPGIDQCTPPMLSPDDVAAALSEQACVVIDLATSRAYRAGHIPGAWFAIRSRLPDNMARLPPASDIILTSEDGTLALLAAAVVQANISARVSVLSGGTAAWRSAGHPLVNGFENLADETDDVNWRPDERSGDQNTAMQEYLSWELGLVQRVERDGTVYFERYPEI